MAHSLSNMTITFPVAPEKSRYHSTTKLSCPNYPYPVGGIGNRGRVKAVGGDGRDKDNLDHLQRASEKSQPLKMRRTAQVAPIGLWDRFPAARTVQQMMETMDRLMEDPLAYNAATWPSQLSNGTGGYSRGRTPWEIKEGEREYKMRFDVPGMTKGDVKVFVEEKMLVVKAEKGGDEKGAGGENGEEWSAKSYGRYSSRIALPENIEFEKIKAEVRDGVLYITIPKASVGTKVVDINVE